MSPISACGRGSLALQASSPGASEWWQCHSDSGGIIGSFVGKFGSFATRSTVEQWFFWIGLVRFQVEFDGIYESGVSEKMKLHQPS